MLLRRFALFFTGALLGLSVLWTLGCSVSTQDSKPGGEAKAGVGGYPHQKDWPATHITYFLDSEGKGASSPQKACLGCHSGGGRVMSLNVSCATSCHTPTTSEARDKIGGRGPKDFKVKNECTKCHDQKIQAASKFNHFPASSGLCTTCHTADPSHLEGQNSKAVTTKTADESCYQCHFRKDDKPNLHPAMLMGDPSCVGCHDPHGSKQRYFLRQPKVAEVCSQCHEAPKGKSIHGAVEIGKACVGCHNPHSSQLSKLLSKEPEELCLSCHNKEIETVTAPTKRTIPNIQRKMRDLPQQHTGALGGCTTCHNAHASENDRLLVANYSTSSYNYYDPQSNPYGLCFTCHDAQMMNQTDASTNFRNDTQTGDKLEQKNLHWFHVVGAAGNNDRYKGRSCRFCHDPHGAEHPFNIGEYFSLGASGKPIPLGFKANSDGGQCTNMCHARKDKIYKRLK